MKNNFILHNIYNFSHICKKSYNTKNLNYYKKIRNDLGLDCFLINDNKNKYLKIVFAGTNEKIDWLSNINIKKFYFNKKKYVHKGAYKMYEKSKKEIISEILQCKYKKIIIMGHSLGGYLSQIMAYDLFIYQMYLIKLNQMYLYMV